MTRQVSGQVSEDAALVLHSLKTRYLYRRFLKLMDSYNKVCGPAELCSMQKPILHDYEGAFASALQGGQP